MSAKKKLLEALYATLHYSGAFSIYSRLSNRESAVALMYHSVSSEKDRDWIDPDNDLYVVLLTNRVNPTAAGDAIHDLRRWVHRAVHGWIVDPMSAPAIARAAVAEPAAVGDVAPSTCASPAPEL